MRREASPLPKHENLRAAANDLQKLSILFSSCAAPAPRPTSNGSQCFRAVRALLKLFRRRIGARVLFLASPRARLIAVSSSNIEFLSKLISGPEAPGRVVTSTVNYGAAVTAMRRAARTTI